MSAAEEEVAGEEEQEEEIGGDDELEGDLGVQQGDDLAAQDDDAIADAQAVSFGSRGGGIPNKRCSCCVPAEDRKASAADCQGPSIKH